MSYLSPNRSPVGFQKNTHSSTKSLAVSLPSINKTQREKVEAFFTLDKDKTKQKLAQNYYPSDISHLKDKKQEIVDLSLPSFPSNLADLLFRYTPEVKIPKDLQKILSQINLAVPARLAGLKSPEIPLLGNTLPSGRQEALILLKYLLNAETKFLPVFEELLASPGVQNKEVLLDVHRSLYFFVLKEIIRQVTIQCTERGDLIGKCLTGLEKNFEFLEITCKQTLESVGKDNETQIKNQVAPYVSEIVLLESKIQRLEKERENMIQTKIEMIIKSKELIAYLEKLKHLDDQAKQTKGKQRYFESYLDFFNKISTDEKVEYYGNTVIEKLKEELSAAGKSLFEAKQKIKKNKEDLKLIQDEIDDKECKLARLNFDLDLKERSKRKVYSISDSNYGLISSLAGKKETSPLSIVLEDEKTHSDRFFQGLTSKSKERLVSKSKVSSDHIFKSLNIIYNRSISQISSYQDYQSFRYFLYKQFVKTDNRKTTEKSLKLFISGCLKFSDNRRISVFLRLANFGEFINKSNFSYRSFLLYLKLFSFSQSSSIGLNMFKDHSSAIQYYPYARVLSCLDEFNSIFPHKTNIGIKSFLEQQKINDPKQINPQGIIEIELFFEVILETSEIVSREINKNLTDLFSPFELINKELPKKVFLNLSDKYKDSIISELDKKDEYRVDDIIELALKTGICSNDLVEDFLLDFVEMQESEARNRLKAKVFNKYIFDEQKLEKLSKQSVLIWLKMLS